MSIFESRPLARWAVPVAAAAIAVGAVAWPSEAKADLPDRSAEQLLVDVQQAKVDGLSGTLSETADLGLPALPAGFGGSTGTSLQSLVTGTHTARVWISGEHLSRIAVQADAQETNIVRNNTDVWQWSSADRTATHVVLPTEAQGKAAAQKHEAAAKAKHPTTKTDAAASMPATPQEAAQKIVSELSKTSTVTTADTATVAGRPVYELVLTPKDATTRVSNVRIAIDGETHVPTRVQVFSTKMATPAVELGFTSITFSAPDASVFAFAPAKDVTVKTTDLTKTQADHPASAEPAQKLEEPTLVTDQNVVGTGWGEIAVGRADLKAMAKLQQADKVAAGQTNKVPAEERSNAAGQTDPNELLKLLPETTGTWGTGRVLDGTLVSAVITTDGRYAIGAVAPEALYKALPAK